MKNFLPGELVSALELQPVTSQVLINVALLDNFLKETQVYTMKNL